MLAFASIKSSHVPKETTLNALEIGTTSAHVGHESHLSSTTRRFSVVQTGLATAVGCCVAWKRHDRRARATRLARPVSTRPYPQGVYNVDTAAEYFQARPLSVLLRATELVAAFTGFASGLFLDKQTGRLESNADARADELCKLLIRLGPTFIKIGQAASIRADLVPPEYLKALTELQDAVPPFPTEMADAILETELGRPVGELFEDISEKPIASASLGQVYKATLRDGPQVAVKVQRPGMEDVVGLDLYLLRIGAPTVKKVLSLISPVNQDLAGLIDAWGEGFVGELDYTAEAANAEAFTAAVANTALSGAVTAPAVVTDCTTKKVLTTEWVDGKRLAESPVSAITTLCSVAMNSYLTMLLEFGVLHADPHPGNLLVTPAGQLCILDWGLVTKMDQELQIRMIEHVANLVSREYQDLGSELIDLGFVPEGKEDDFRGSEVQAVLASAYDQYTDGGGAAKFNIGAYFDQLQVLGMKYGSIFRVPPYFFYIARAFLVLEGIGLSNDPEYSILGECLPYVSQRLLKDKSPRAERALTTFLYGKEKDLPNRIINIKQFERLSSGLSDYTSAADGFKPATLPAGKVVDQMVQLLLGEADGENSNMASPTQLQAIVIDELAKVLGASVRKAVAALNLFPSADESNGGDTRWSAVSPDRDDLRTLETAERIRALAQPRAQALIDSFQALEPPEQRRVANEVVTKLWAYRENIALTGGRIAIRTISQGVTRLTKGLTS